VLYPPGDKHHDADVAPGCPPFGFDSVITRPDGVDPSFAVMPGLHTPRQGGHKVVWWDPASLRLGVETDGALRQQRILTADQSRVRSDAGVRAHDAWSSERDALLARGGVETFVVRAATEIAEARALAAIQGEKPAPISQKVSITVEKTQARRDGRPRGKRFGTLVHGLLAEAPLGATRDVVRRMAALHGRAVSASTREVEAATHAVLAALAHPLLLRAAESKGVRRECPVLTKLEDGALVEGFVDLAFRDDSAGAPVWELVDFKTDLELEANRAVYEAQLELYAKGIAEATGEPVRATLLLV
jgi:ATP-dependent exoDNAse (exonuclease V) beta subunit